jgi:hypothetical protein
LISFVDALLLCASPTSVLLCCAFGSLKCLVLLTYVRALEVKVLAVAPCNLL